MGDVIKVDFPEPPRRCAKIETGVTYITWHEAEVQFGPMFCVDEENDLWTCEGYKYTGFLWNGDGTMFHTEEEKRDRLERLGTTESCFDLRCPNDEYIQLDLFRDLLVKYN